MHRVKQATQGSLSLCLAVGALLIACLLSALTFASDCPTGRCPSSKSDPAQLQCRPDQTTASSLLVIRDSQTTLDGTTANAKHIDVDTANGDVDANGGVELHQGQRILRTEEVHRDGVTGEWTIPGTVELSDPNLTVSGKGAKVTDDVADFSDTHFEIPARAGHGSAGHIRLIKDGELQLSAVRYTTCAGPKPDWELKVDSLHIDAQAREGSARNARIDFKGVPILYTPYISFPVGNERKSGFLFPSLGNSSRSGTQLAIPWYWNIAPNYDATITPTWYSARGVDLSTEFRYLTERSHGTLQANFLPHDRQAVVDPNKPPPTVIDPTAPASAVDNDTTGENRSFIALQSQTDLTSQLRLNAEGVKVSDASWLEDIGNGVQPTTVSVLPRWAQFIYRSDEWFAAARAQNYQIIDSQIPIDSRPYTILPQLVFHGFYPNRPYGLDYSIDGEFANFRGDADRFSAVTTFTGQANDYVISAQRLDIYPEIRLPLRRGGFYVEPSAGWRYTAYKLADAIDASTDRSPTREAPIFSIDSGVAFERASGRDGQRIQTLEPRLLYLYVPYRDQSNLPILDTELPDFNLIQLFRTNRYVSADRLGDANQLAVGMTTRLLDAADGQQFLSATVGEIYRFATPKVLLPNEAPDTDRNSDLVAEMELTRYKHWNARLGVQIDTNERSLQRTEVGVQYRPEAGQVVNVGYRFRKSSATGLELNQTDTSLAWPIGNRFNVYGRFIYSLKDEAVIDRMAGLEYRDCCWGLRFIGRRAVSLSGDTETSWQLQIELNGLSNVGNRVDAFLAQSIRGYSATRIDNDRYGL